MPFYTTPIEGLLIFEPNIHADERGYFYESYNRNLFEKNGVFVDFVQDNQSLSSYGVLRGLHYQVGECAQTKLVRVIIGEVLDVAVDLRRNSVTYGQWFSVRLSGENHKQFLIPAGFAHGYVVLSEQALFSYKCDNFYNKNAEGGLHFADPNLNIDWEIDLTKVIVSNKDAVLPILGEHREL
ncbi:MAG: dTDP-4-dehydrorhamnose 3,5-epimerase [Saprospiraceae bacterium]|nr:dTDP-4-dehydrorhamnose 3,5-epimerase [Saprospiraceae bacterium]